MADIDRTWLRYDRLQWYLYHDGTVEIANYDTTVNRTSSFRKHEKERRVKPLDLIGSMTARSPQWFETERTGIADHLGFVTNTKTYYLRNDMQEGIALREYGSVPTWDWSLRIRKKVEKLQVNLGTSLVEYRETANMFRGFANAVKDAGGRLMKLRKYKKAPIQAIAKHYLQYSYGLRPLATDLGESLATLATRLELPIYRKASTSHGFAERKEIDFHEGYHNHRYLVNYKRAVRERAVCYYQVEPGFDGVVMGSLPEILWEVTPLSHVIDMGINVGEYLGSLDAMVGTTKNRINYSKKAKYDHVKVSYPGYTGLITVEPNTVLKRRYHRDYMIDLPLPNLPTWKPSKSWWTIANATALLAGMVPGVGARRWATHYTYWSKKKGGV